MSYAVAFNILSFGKRRKMKNLVLQQRNTIILDFFYYYENFCIVSIMIRTDITNFRYSP